MTTITMAFGECLRTFSVHSFTILELVFSRSSRLMPGLRAMPAVMITRRSRRCPRSRWCRCTRASEPFDRRRLQMSSALPCGMPSTTSKSTTSPSSRSASRWASVAADVAAADHRALFCSSASFVRCMRRCTPALRQVLDDGAARTPSTSAAWRPPSGGRSRRSRSSRRCAVHARDDAGPPPRPSPGGASIISPDRITEPGFTLSRLAYFGAVPCVASKMAWPVT